MKLKDFDFRIWYKNNYLDDPAYIIYRFYVEKDFDECFKHECFNEVEIELWSGLCDKNGNKIFDGDLIKFDDDSVFKVCCGKNFSFYFKKVNCKFKEGEIILIDSLHEKVEGVIVGNIHETKHYEEALNE